MLKEKRFQRNKKESTEHKEGEPNFLYHFLYVDHSSKESVDLITSRFPEADVYCVERSLYSDIDEKLLESLSDGSIDIEEVQHRDRSYLADKKGQVAAELSALNKSGKAVVVLDISNTHPDAQEWYDQSKQEEIHGNNITRAFADGELKKAVSEVRKFYDTTAKMHVIRERAMLDRLNNLPNILKDKYPEVANKPEVKVLIALGAFHTSVYNYFDNKNKSREFNEYPYVFSLQIDLARRIRMEKSIPTEEECAQVIVEVLVKYGLRELSLSENDSTIIGRYIATQVPYGIIDYMSQEIFRESRGSSAVVERVIRIVIENIESIGIQVPHSVEEANALLAKIKKGSN